MVDMKAAWKVVRMVLRWAASLVVLMVVMMAAVTAEKLVVTTVEPSVEMLGLKKVGWLAVCSAGLMVDTKAA